MGQLGSSLNGVPFGVLTGIYKGFYRVSIRVPCGGPFVIRVPNSVGDLKRGPSLENYPIEGRRSIKALCLLGGCVTCLLKEGHDQGGVA